MRKLICASSPWHLWVWKVTNLWFRKGLKRKMNPQLLFQLRLSQRGLFRFCFGIWNWLLWPTGCRSPAARPSPTTHTCSKRQNQRRRRRRCSPAIRATACAFTRTQPHRYQRPPKAALGPVGGEGAQRLHPDTGCGGLRNTRSLGPRGPAAPPVLPGELETPHTSSSLCTTAL